MNTEETLSRIRNGASLNSREQFLLILRLSLPAMLSQISSLIMEFIDASMVGQLGREGSAAIGLISTTTWLVGGLTSAVGMGFYVLTAQKIGAKEEIHARNLVREGLLVTFLFSFFIGAVCALISGALPVWLGGEESVCRLSTQYFFVYALSVPITSLLGIAAGMIQASGNMRIPSFVHILMGLLDVVFNFFLIFPTRSISLFNAEITVPGFGWGVLGAAIGTFAAYLIGAALMLVFLLFRSPVLRLRSEEKMKLSREDMKASLKISGSVAFEQTVRSGAQILLTRVISPLGTVAVAAHSLATTAEGFCYMPGYGVASAATALIGQSYGAGRKQLTRRLGWLCTLTGMGIMAATGCLMFFLAPEMLAFLTPDPEIRELGTLILRIEAFAEPLFAAEIVSTGVFRGAGDVIVPSCMTLFCMWVIRIPTSILLAPVIGLKGVWIAMAVELSIRGIFFLIRLSGKKWWGGKEKVQKECPV